ncbi:MAG TPA: ABC transporter ATP-binding protein [Planctomycetota bacterium]|nr:ABC transporter ATP-binding protein [Planctomycetota bacterium]
MRIDGLCKGFGSGSTRIEVLHDIALEARKGEMLFVVGPSGCGKTTLLTLIAGMLDADKGDIQLFGQSITRMNAAQKTAFRRDNIGFIFQQFNLLPTLTASENAAVPMLIKEAPRKEAVSKAADLLKGMKMGHRLNAFPSQMSGGEQQRVAIARSLVAAPRLLVCDEPTASLDGETGHKVMETLRSTALKDNRCAIVVTHDSRIFRFADRIARMEDGRIKAITSAELSD